MNQKVVWSSLLVSGLIVGATAASADGLPVLASSACPVATGAAPDMACGHVETSAEPNRAMMVRNEDGRDLFVATRRVVALAGLSGPQVFVADLPVGSIPPKP